MGRPFAGVAGAGADLAGGGGCCPDPLDVAGVLHVTVKTMHAHKTAILGECRNAWELPGDTGLDYHFRAKSLGTILARSDMVAWKVGKSIGIQVCRKRGC